jgi:RNA polymerase sigma-70 factor (ECF subfamily)
MHTDTIYDELRPLLFSVAYRMTGSVADAEDLVQEAFVRYERSAPSGVESPKALLSTIVTRLAIDHLRSARVRREQYVGDWLPEPLVAAEPADPAETADSLSLAFLVVLETLSPVERAVFLLREVFGYEYDEIARIVGKSEANCRQIAVRARRHVDARRPRFEASREAREELAERFFAACVDGDTEALVELLARDVVVYGDGGGKAPQLARAVHGADRAARLLAGWFHIARDLDAQTRRVVVNGQPGLVLQSAAGEVASVLALDIADGKVQAVRSIVNPDKLRHLGPVADVRGALRERRER